MVYLVTGGAGFIGSHIVDRLSADGHHVRILDDFSTGKRENTAASPDAEIITGDVGDFDTVRAAMEGVNAVFHQAAIASVPATVANPLASERTNYRGTLNVLEAARHAGTQRVIFACTAAVYGDLPGLPKREDMPLRSLSPYAVDKLASECACQMYHHLYGLETVALRYFNVFGPRQDPASPYSGVISIFSDSLRQGKHPVIYGDGEQTRDFVYVSDVVEANIRALNSATAPGKAINIATGGTLSINNLLQTICQLQDHAFSPVYKTAREGDIRHSHADIQLAREHLDWQPAVGLEAGLRMLFSG
ncbi:MAG: NAD-dependent epimerase/dehydratase family protein [Gammaproteobacteria bacterium]